MTMNKSGNLRGFNHLSEESIEKIRQTLDEKRPAWAEGWPKPVARFGTPDYHEVTNDEFNHRVLMSRSRW